MKKFIFEYYPFFLLSFPIFLATGPFLSDLSVSLSSLLFLFYFSELKNQIILLKKMILFFIIFWLLFVVNSFVSENWIISLKSSFFSIRFLFFSLIIFYFFSNNKIYIQKFNFILRLVIIFLCIDALFQYVVGYNFFGFEKQSRLSGVFESEWILGSFLSKAFALMISLSFYNETKNLTHKNEFYINIFILLLVYVTVVLTFERAAFIFLNLFVFFLFLFVKQYRKYLFIILGLIVLVNLLYLSNLDHYKNRYVKNFLSQIDFQNKEFFLLKDYSDMFLTSYEIFKNKPLTGSGNKNFQIDCKIYLDKYPKGCSNHPHNYYAQFLAENGLSGIIFISFAFIYFSYLLFRNLFVNNISSRNFHISFCLTLILITQPFTTTGNFFHNWNLCIISLIFGFSLINRNLQIKSF